MLAAWKRSMPKAHKKALCAWENVWNAAQGSVFDLGFSLMKIYEIRLRFIILHANIQ